MQIIHGDALDTLRSLPDHSVDAIVSDPPAGVSFMGKSWDSDKGGRDAWIAWLAEIMREARRMIKPGGHALIWALPRTSHWTALALEDAGFEIRDSIQHVFSTGFPKSHDVSKAIDRIAGSEREVIGDYRYASRKGGKIVNSYMADWGDRTQHKETSPATPEAQQYSGFGTALKPAHETWWLCRAPLSEPTIAANVLKWGVGGLNIDGTRIETQDQLGRMNKPGVNGWKNSSGGPSRATYDSTAASGRFPSNFLLSHSLFCTEDQCVDDCPVLALDRQSGNSKSVDSPRRNNPHIPNAYGAFNNKRVTHGHNDQGGASRFFQTFYYCPKPSKRERSAGCDELPEGKSTYREHDPEENSIRTRLHGSIASKKASKNHHPTVKSVALMKYLITMITPPGGIVLDCFGGSGTTAVAAIEGGFDCILIEKEQEYIDIINARVQHVLKSACRKLT